MLCRPGPFQLEAAIQSAHCERVRSGATPWPMIAMLYGALRQHWPSNGASVAAAVARTECGDAALALAQLEALPAAAVADYAPHRAARAHALQARGRRVDSSEAYRRAAGLAGSAPVRAFLLRKSRQLSARAIAAGPHSGPRGPVG